jgi:isocitrate dehydrogenase
MPTVEEVMTRGVISVDENDSIEDAMRTMVERHVSSLIVAKNSDNDVYGIITRKDVINHIIAGNQDLKKTKVSELMTKPVMTITKQMDVVAAAKLMERTNVRRFPVCDGDKLLGIISNSDIFRAYVIDNIIEKQHKKSK